MSFILNIQSEILTQLKGLRLSIISISLLLFLIVFTGNAFPQANKDSATLPKLIAEKYGINYFGDISSIKFTFNVKSQNVSVKRTWKWELATGLVEFTGKDNNGKDTTFTYNRKKLDSKNTLEINADKRFINDQYWLLFPFHLVWDNNVDITFKGEKESPISHKKRNSLVVQYKNNVGYTPNDAFVLFLGKDNMIKEWTYRPGGSKKKERSYTWESNKKFDGITISTVHNGEGNKFKVWFTDISVVTNHK